MSFVIKKLTAFVAVGEDGDEGVMGALLDGTMTPLVCADEERIKSLYPLAKEISEVTNTGFRVVQFSVREDVTEEITKKYETIQEPT